ncbi:MAG: hypothetical protein LC794_18670 [Acidobacteria bacterium]|nr:hypothetical protein [Acidobacteriota bacterium]
MVSGSFSNQVLLVVVLLAPALIAGASGPPMAENFLVAEGFNAAQQVHSPTEDVQSKPVDHKVARTIDSRKEGGGLYLLISVAPEDFVRERMTQLARQLNRDYENESKLIVSIFDNETTARNVIPAGHQYSEFKKAERGVYHLDRRKGVEYLHFSTKPGRPSNEIKLNLRRARPQRTQKTT